MKRIIVLAVVCALAPLASAQLYKYVDKNGKTVYTDQPPPDAEAKPMGNIPSAAGSAGKTYVERDKELQKGRDKAKDEAKKADEKSKAGAEREESCRQATAQANMYDAGGRFMTTNAQGEKVYMTDEEIEAAKQRAHRDVDEVCKK
ncbi:MAG TPA: DUF4124 domain-containing protein [Usitatibacter sp.]|nr:DUF4124 domain-containing protein [Usitatibacter sp.]